MNREQIMEAIRTLAKSQGFYSRLLELIESDTEAGKKMFLDSLESQNFSDVIDLINFLEG